MKTSRPPEYTPEEWKMMSKYYTKEEKAEVKGGGKKKEEDPKSKESEISAPTLQMPGGKHLAELEWVRIVVNPVDGVVVLMDSKQSQDVLERI